MTLTDEQQKEIIPEFDLLIDRASNIARQINYLQGNLSL